MVETRKLEKVNENKYLLTTENTDIKSKTTREYTKEELKEVYDDILDNLSDARKSLVETRKKATAYEALTVEEKEDIQSFMNKLELAQKFKDGAVASAQIPEHERYIELLETGKKDIEKVLPELTRGKK